MDVAFARRGRRMWETTRCDRMQAHVARFTKGPQPSYHEPLSLSSYRQIPCESTGWKVAVVTARAQLQRGRRPKRAFRALAEENMRRVYKGPFPRIRILGTCRGTLAVVTRTISRDWLCIAHFTIYSFFSACANKRGPKPKDRLSFGYDIEASMQQIESLGLSELLN